MAGLSLLAQFTRVAGQIGAILNHVDIDVVGQTELRLVGTIKRLLADARLDIRDWEMADSRQEMQRCAREALERLDQVRRSILLASEHDMFSAVEIAEISSHFDHAAAELRRSFALPEEP